MFGCGQSPVYTLILLTFSRLHTHFIRTKTIIWLLPNQWSNPETLWLRCHINSIGTFNIIKIIQSTNETRAYFMRYTARDVTCNTSHQICTSPYRVLKLHVGTRDNYGDVILGAIASQITSLAIVYSGFYSGADKKNVKAPRPWPLCGEFTGDRWIPHTSGQ